MADDLHSDEPESEERPDEPAGVSHGADALLFHVEDVEITPDAVGGTATVGTAVIDDTTGQRYEGTGSLSGLGTDQYLVTFHGSGDDPTQVVVESEHREILNELIKQGINTDLQADVEAAGRAFDAIVADRLGFTPSRPTNTSSDG